MKRLSKGAYLPDVQKRFLTLIEQAFPIQEAIEETLAQLVKGGKPDDSLHASLRNLTNQLESLVERMEGERAAVRFAGLKLQVRVAAGRSSSWPGRSLTAAIVNGPPKLARGDEPAQSGLGVSAPERRHIKSSSRRPSGP